MSSTKRGKYSKSGQTEIEGPWVFFTLKMLTCPAYRALTFCDRIVLDRLLIEHMSHAGTENGNLACTYDDFVEFGIRRKSIRPAIDRLEALGFIAVKRFGYRGLPCRRAPNCYRVTFVRGKPKSFAGEHTEPVARTDDWEHLDTTDKVEAAPRRVRKTNRQAENIESSSVGATTASSSAEAAMAGGGAVALSALD